MQIRLWVSTGDLIGYVTITKEGDVWKVESKREATGATWTEEAVSQEYANEAANATIQRWRDEEIAAMIEKHGGKAADYADDYTAQIVEVDE